MPTTPTEADPRPAISTKSGRTSRGGNRVPDRAVVKGDREKVGIGHERLSCLLYEHEVKLRNQSPTRAEPD